MARLRTATTIAAAAALTLPLAGCASDDTDDTSTSSDGSSPGSASSSGNGSSTSSSPTSSQWDKDHALAQAKKAIRARDQHDVNEQLTEDDEFASPEYVRGYNQELQKIKDMEATRKGSITTTSVHLKELNPDAIGGPDLTVITCSISTVRLYGPQGKDVTGDPQTGEPLPKKPQKNAHLVSLITTDKGKTWDIANAQQLHGNRAKETPCDVTE